MGPFNRQKQNYEMKFMYDNCKNCKYCGVRKKMCTMFIMCLFCFERFL